MVLEGEALRRLRHDLRAPLLVVAGFADALAGGRPVTEAERREFARRIRGAADELRARLDEALGDGTPGGGD